MAYIGREPQIGNFQVCDAISTVNNQAAYTMQVGGVNVSPETANHMLVSLNGILQAPTTSYTVSGSTITFASNLVTGDVINFIQILGSVLDLGVPSDATVSTAKIVDGAVTSAKLASGVGGKVLQVVQTVKTDTFSTTATSYTAVTGLSVAITPSSSSSKILVMVAISLGTSSYTAHYSLRRGSTDILLADAASNRARTTAVASPTDSNSDRTQEIVSTTYLDSPSTTSATTYQAFIKCRNTSQTVYVNRSHNDNDAATYDPRTTSTITVMEIGA